MKTTVKKVETNSGIRRILLVGVLATLLASLAWGAGAPAPRPDVLQSTGQPAPLFALEKTALPKGIRPLLPNTAEEFLIRVDPANVAADPPSFLIDLPGHALMEAVRTSFVSYRADWKSWFGTLRYASGGQKAGSIDISYHGAQITALVELDEGDRYRIVGGFGESHRLVRLDAEKTPMSCGLGAKADARDGTGDTPSQGGEPRARQAPLASAKILSCSANARIDVLVVYPGKGDGTRLGYFDLSAADENALFSFVQNSIAKANQVFANNGINAWYNLVGLVPLINQDNLADPPLPSTGLRAVLDWMNQEHTELKNLRDAFGADVIAVYTPFAWEGTVGTSDRACGLANLPRNDNAFEAAYGTVYEPMGQRAFTAHRDTCGLDDLTLAHEIGHNYGMRHDDDNDVIHFLFPWGTTNNNNARVACDTVNEYSKFKDPQPDTPPIPSITVSCSNMTCTFNGSSSYDHQTYVSKWFWDFGDGKTATGSSVRHTYTNAGTRRVHLVVTDSQGQTAAASSTASPNTVAKEAQIVSQSVPTTMVAGQQYAVSVTVTNTGSLTWSPIGPQCNAYRLAQVGSAAWNPTRTELPAPLASGGQVTLNFNVVAPATPGLYNFQVQMVHECVEFFPNPGPNVVVNVQPPPIKKALFLAQNVPSPMVAGQAYSVSLTIQNVGNVTWSPIGPQCNAYRLAQIGDAVWNPTRVELPTALTPGQQVTLAFNVTAPAGVGTYNFQMKMVHECVEWFNDPSPPNVTVTVTAPPQLSPHFGPVLTSAHVVFIFWGPTFNDVASPDYDYARTLQNFRNQFGTTPEYNTITQYGGNNGTIALTHLSAGTPDWFDNSTPLCESTLTPLCEVTDSIARAEVDRYLATPHAFDRNAIYEVVLPVTSSSRPLYSSRPDGTNSCGGPVTANQYCGYHSCYPSLNNGVCNNVDGNIVKYSVEPYPSCDFCRIAGWTEVQIQEKLISHETREAVTDPQLTTWFDANGNEADDKCDPWNHPSNPPFFGTGGYVYQDEWSNALMSCTHSTPITTPLQPIWEGYHDIATCRDIYGWAWDQNWPNAAINVDVYRDNSYLTTVPANIFRQDLLDAGKGNGYHGFDFVPDSSWRDGQWHSASVRFPGTSMNLNWTPRNIICSVSMFPPPLSPQYDLPTGGLGTVGTQFYSSQNGYVTDLGFFRASGETGSNTLRLWTDSGSQLASVPTNCNGSGWCWASISPAVAISAGTLYRVSVTVNSSHSKTPCGIGSGITNQVLTAPQGFWDFGDTFPTTPSCSNFFVDVKFDM
jgi:hypothetical protein